MKYATISTKLQVTFSKADLEHLGVEAGEKVTVEHDKGCIIIRPMLSTITSQVAGLFKDHIPEASYARPFDEIISVTRKRAASRISNR